MKNFIKPVFLFFCSALFLVSCSSDDSNSEEPFNSDSEKIVAENFQATVDKFELPNNFQNSSDTNVQGLSAIVESQKNTLKAFSGFFIVPDNAVFTTSAKQANDVKTYTWTDGQGTTVVYTFAETKDGFNIEYVWTANGETLTLFTGFLSKDGDRGNLTFYPNEPQQKVVYSWEFSNNVLSYNVSTAFEEIKMLINGDGSGSLDFFEDGIKTLQYTWNADGSGSYTNLETGETFTWTAA